MKKLLLVAIVLLLSVSFTVSASGNAEDASKNSETRTGSSEPVVLKMGMIAPVGHPVEIGSRRFSELVAERTNGQVVIELHPGGVLGGEVEMQNAAKLGTIDMINVGCGVTSGTIPEYNIASFHYVWKNPEHMHKVMNSDLVHEWDAEYLKKSGLRILSSNWEQGNRHMVCKKPVETVEDLAGIKIRVPQAEAFIDAWKAMGANPTPMAFGEVYTALQQGVVDAIEVPLDWIEKMKFYEQAKYIILTGHLQYVNQVQINEKVFQKLSAENREILSQAAVEAGDYSTEVSRSMIDDLRKSIEDQGITFIEVDRSKFAEKVYTIVPDFENQWGAGLWDTIQSMAD